jgi:hypothetical protein
MVKPLIGTGNADEVREMTDEEYEALLATGWTLEGTELEAPTTPE